MITDNMKGNSMPEGKGRIIETIKSICENIALDSNTELIDVSFVRENNERILRVLIDKRGGVGLDDCENFSQKLSDILDEKDPIEQNYLLEVSSPGIDRPLSTQRDFDLHIDETIEIKLRKPVEHKTKYEGVLISRDDNTTIIRFKDNELTLNNDNIKTVRRTVIF